VERCLACEAVLSRGRCDVPDPSLSALYVATSAFTDTQKCVADDAHSTRATLLTTASQARQRSTVGKPLSSWRNWKQKTGGCAVSIKLSCAIHEFPFRSAGP